MNYGKIIRLTFSGKVYHVSNIEKTRFRLINGYNEYMYPTSLTYGANENEVYLHFDDINNFGAEKLECLGTIAMGSEYVSFGAFIIDIFLQNLWPIPGLQEYIQVSNVSVAGQIAIAFDGKAYFSENTSYAAVSTVTVAGTLTALVFNKRYFDENTSYAAVSTVTVAGQYCDINGVPL